MERIAERVVELLLPRLQHLASTAAPPSHAPDCGDEVDAPEEVREEVRELLAMMRRNGEIHSRLHAERERQGIRGDALLGSRAAANRCGYPSLRGFEAAMLSHLRAAGEDIHRGGRRAPLWWRSDLDRVVATRGYGPRGGPVVHGKRRRSAAPQP